LEGPGAALALDADPGGDDVDDAIGDRGRAVGHPGVQDAVDVGALVHREVPPTAATRASASSAARMA
jgi:hypothetical protein